jgi:hypothetical protein
MISKILTKTGGAKKSKTNEKKKVVKKTKTKSKGKVAKKSKSKSKGKAKVSKKTKTKSKGKVAKKSKSKSKGKKKVQKGGAKAENIVAEFEKLSNGKLLTDAQLTNYSRQMEEWFNSMFTITHGRKNWYDITDEEYNQLLNEKKIKFGNDTIKFIKKCQNETKFHNLTGGAKKYKSKSKSKSKAKVAKKSKSKSKSKAKVAKKSKSKSKGKKVKREPNMFIKTLMEVKKHVKKMDLPEDVKDGPAMTKIVAVVMKAKDMDAKKSVEHIKDNFSKFLNDYKKTQHEMEKKRAAKKAAKSA